MLNADELIDLLNLEPHPEGGAFAETYRSSEEITTADGRVRNIGTAIYFLLREGQLSQWHRVASDELWYYHAGDPLILEVIDHHGNFTTQKLGMPASTSETDIRPQRIIKAHEWQRAYTTGTFTMLSCTVHPGFSFDDFEMGAVDSLANEYPQLENEIRRNPLADE